MATTIAFKCFQFVCDLLYYPFILPSYTNKQRGYSNVLTMSLINRPSVAGAVLQTALFNRPRVAGAVLQTSLLLIKLLIKLLNN